MTFLHKHFASSREFANWFVKQPPAPVEDPRSGRHFASDKPTVAQGLHTLLAGDESNLHNAQELLDQFQESIETLTYTPQLSMAGGFPSIPAFLSGQPEHMYSMQPDYSERTPLRILVGLTSSAAVSPTQLAQRGCTLAAFALALSSKRTVYITPFLIDGHEGYSYRSGNYRGDRALISWDIATSPLVLSELMGCLSSPSVTRYLGLAATARLNPTCDGSITPYDVTEAQVRERIPNSQDAIYLPSIHLHDPLLTDPIKWVRTNLAKYSETQEYN